MKTLIMNNKRELKRKFFHLLAGSLYIFGYYILPRIAILWIMGLAFILATLLELIRVRYPHLNRFLLSLFGGLYRPEEELPPSAATFTVYGAFLTMFLFSDRRIVLTALGCQVFGDGLAALVGLEFGKIKIGKKSLEGALACFFVCFLIGLIFFDFRIALLCALAATIIEMLPTLLLFSDNLAVPLLTALFLKIIVY